MGSVTQNTVCLYSMRRRLPPLQPPRLRCELVLVVRPLAIGEDLAQLRAPGRIGREPGVDVRRFDRHDAPVVSGSRHFRRWVVGDRRE
ncbi:hypothetical protein Y048_6416 [Burkholderia pseudomallei MSHR456]|nr:hypothetical protein Y048_6416 [Burkholderia pseudomallei MSHR456]